MASITRLPFGAPLIMGLNTTLSFSTFALNGTTDALEFIFQADEAATITHLGFRYGIRTGTPPTYRISLQGVNASGEPDGTIKAGTNAFGTFTPPASTAWDGTRQWVALGSSYTCARGEFLAIVIDYSSGTADGSNNGTFSVHMTGTTGRGGPPYAIQNDATVRTRTASYPIFMYKSASKSYGVPLSNVTETQYSSDSNPNERALKFTLPSGMCSTYNVLGVRFACRFPVAGKTLTVRLYEGTTVRQDVTLDSDVRGGAATLASNIAEVIFDESSLHTLNAGTAYYIAFAPNETSSLFALSCYVATDAQDATALGGDGNWYLSTRNGGAWSDDTTQRPLVELLLSDMTGGGGHMASRAFVGF